MLLNYIFRLLFVLFGAFDIDLAIKAYHEGKYFLCGFEIMFAAYAVIYLFKLSIAT